MENIRTSSTHAVWLMVSIVLVALNLRPSMAAVGPLLSAIRGEVPLSFSSASLLTMLPVMAMGVAMFLGMRIALRKGHYTVGAYLGHETGIHIYDTALAVKAVAAASLAAMSTTAAAQAALVPTPRVKEPPTGAAR